MRTRSADYLLNEAASALAEVRERVWDGRSLPVPIEAIAEQHFGLLIREAHIEAELPELGVGPPAGHPISGALIPERAEILVDATEASRSPRRRRCTIAHELGHWVLHRGPEATLCREVAVRPVETVTGPGGEESARFSWEGDPGEPGIEWEANLFGGALLLPPALARRAWQGAPGLEALAEALDVTLPAVAGGWARHYDFLGG